MKPFDQLTDEELTSLTAEQFNAYADSALLESGIGLLPEPAHIIPIPASQVFDVQAVAIGAMIIDTESAAKIQEIVNQGTLYNKNPNKQSLEPLTESQHYYRPSFDKQLCMSPILARKHEMANAPAIAKQLQLQERHRVYQEFLTEKAQTLDGLISAVQSAETRLYKLHTATQAKRRALEIAGGDAVIAERIYETFLAKH